MFVNESAMQGKVNTPSSQQNRLGNVSYPSRTIIHPKLELTEPGDSDEQEADAAASDVMSGKVCRKISGGGAGGGMAVSSQMESQLNHLQGGGQSMPAGLRGMMERGFDRDFSQVRLHTDSEAAGLSSSINAKAFTHGNDIYFNRGQFSPETSEGQRLVAHELAHVAQGGGKVGRWTGHPQKKPIPAEFLLKWVSLARKMIVEAENLLGQVNENIGIHFWGSNFSSQKENIKGNYVKIDTDLKAHEAKLNVQVKNQSALDGQETQNQPEFADIFGLSPNDAKLNGYEIAGLHISDSADIWVKTELKSQLEPGPLPVLKAIDEGKCKDGKIASVIIHELSHSLLGTKDSAYFDQLLTMLNGWDSVNCVMSSTSSADTMTADAYSSFAYFSLYAPYVLLSDDLDGLRERVNIVMDYPTINRNNGEPPEEGKSPYTFSNSGTYSSIFVFSELGVGNVKNGKYEEYWSNKVAEILRAADITSIEKIKDEENKYGYDVYGFLDIKYCEYMNLFMKNRLNGQVRILYWLSCKASDVPNPQTKESLKRIAEKELN